MGNLSQLQQLGIASAGVSAAGSLVSGYGQYQAGQEQKAAYDYNAAVALEEMRDKAQTSEDRYATLVGKQASAYARAGVDIASGSPLLIMAHTAYMSGKEQESEAEQGDQQSALQRYYGRLAAFNGTIGGISTFLSGLSKSAIQTAGILGPSSSSSSSSGGGF
jgi:hypothetical protein